MTFNELVLALDVILLMIYGFLLHIKGFPFMINEVLWNINDILLKNTGLMTTNGFRLEKTMACYGNSLVSLLKINGPLFKKILEL